MASTKGISLQYVHTAMQTADISTKSLAGPTHKVHTESLGLADWAGQTGSVLVTTQVPTTKSKPKKHAMGKCFRCKEIGHFKADCPNRPKGKLSLVARLEPGMGKESEMVVHLKQTRTYQINATTKGDAKPVVKIVPVGGPTHEKVPNTHAPANTYPIDETMNPEDLRGVEIDSDWSA